MGVDKLHSLRIICNLKKTQKEITITLNVALILHCSKIVLLI